jgi:hypothetical protein
LEHRRERRLARASTSVAGRYRQADHRHVDEACHESGEHAIHAGGHDDDLGAPFEGRGKRTDESVQARDSEVCVEPHLNTARLNDHLRFLGRG